MRAPLDSPHDLTIPEAGSTTTRTIFSRALGRTCHELPALVRAHAGASRDDVLAFDRALTPVMRESPGAIASLLRHPHLSTLLRALRSAGADKAQDLVSELMALVSFDLAWRGVVPTSITLRRCPRRLLSLAARVTVDLPAATTAVTFRNGSILVEGPDGIHELDLRSVEQGGAHPWLGRPYRVVEGPILLALADNNPLSSIEAHPDKKTPNTVDLGGHDEHEWLTSIREALGIIGKHLPAQRADIDVVLQQIVPTGYDPEKHLSCSYQEDIGTIYVSLHPAVLTMAEAIIHEVSHNKLNALLDLDPILQNARSELHASPIRPDPRPLHGVLLAVHAFLPVARLYEAILSSGDPALLSQGEHQRLKARYVAVIQSNRAGMEVLEAHARPTRIGKGLLDELVAWETHFRGVG